MVAIDAPQLPPIPTMAPLDPAAAADGRRSPPAPTKKSDKVVPPPPPAVIYDSGKKRSYKRAGFLGEGGFARVYEVIDPEGRRRAVKVVHKASIRTKKNKTKLWAEIKLHQMLEHPHVVRFIDCFEDDENVYMILELCDNGSLMDLLRRRKRYTEPEARFFLVQLIGACQYMHDNNVIHRDLKLGNLFLDNHMNVKVGDFGLAALIENEGERKKTICGTPNYIAPEVLFDTANGHSFEVDIWSVGVILYTLLIGKPPFQTKDVKAIYRRIRENRYEFPPDKEISSSAQELIMSILNSDPEQRPTLQAILQHQWFIEGAFPSYIPQSANDAAPVYAAQSAGQSRRNFEMVKRRAAGEPPSTTPPPPPRTSSLGHSIAAQERDFNNAVQPDSPISALLSSARQPLVQAPPTIKEQSLLRKLTAAGAQSTLSPVRRGTLQRPPTVSASRAPEFDEVAEEEEEPDDAPRGMTDGRDREVAHQKARIVSQMAGMKISDKERDGRETASSGSTTPTRAPLGESNVPQPTSSAASSTAGRKSNVYDLIEANLTSALRMGQTEVGFRTPYIQAKPPKVFVVSWLDYCAKYGMGFAMTDGTVCVHFNDSTSLVLAPGKQHFDHIAPDADRTYEHRRNYPIDTYPVDLKTKVYLLHQFEKYMLDRLVGNHQYTYVDVEKTRGMVYIEKYLRMKHVILFRLSNGLLQFNFYDHTKLILSEGGLVVTVIDKHYALYTWSLEELCGPLPDAAESKERRMMERVRSKLEYIRDVLGKIRAHGGMGMADAAVRQEERERRDREREKGTERDPAAAARPESHRPSQRTDRDREREQREREQREREQLAHEKEKERERERERQREQLLRERERKEYAYARERDPLRERELERQRERESQRGYARPTRPIR